MNEHFAKTLTRRCALLALILPAAAGAQGSLAPPGAPAPTMKTLTQVEPRTPISALPFVITNAGSYYLTTNVIAIASNPGITISANNVTLDLNGFTVQGVPTAGTAVSMPNACTNVTVRNGVITGWSNNGVYGTAVYNLLCERLTISDVVNYGIYCIGSGTVRDCLVQSAGPSGIYINIGILSGCTARCSGGYGISAYYSTVLNCTVAGGHGGIWADHSTVSGCSIQSGGGLGIHACSSAVSGCFVQGFSYSGIWLDTSGCQIIGNNCIGNNTSASTSDAGIYVYCNNNRVENNHVTGSGYAGIYVLSGQTGNVVIRNTVTGTGTNNYVTNSTSAFGPIITTSGTITNLNPWANFSY